MSEPSIQPLQTKQEKSRQLLDGTKQEVYVCRLDFSRC